jgi:hypothetical protein
MFKRNPSSGARSSGTAPSFGRLARAASASAGALGLAFAAAFAGSSAHAATLCDNWNTQGVTQGALRVGQTNCFFAKAAHLTGVATYHWNGGRGAQPGTITLQDVRTGRIYGPFRASGGSGQGGASNVDWIANLNINVAAGTELAVWDSDPRTWSYNAASTSYRGFGGGYGFVRIFGDGAASSFPAPILPPSPTPLPPFRPPTPAPTPPSGGGGVLTHTPCHANSASFVELAKPTCGGPRGTVLMLYVSRYRMPAAPTVAYFRSGAGYNAISQQLGGAMNTPGLAALFSAPLTLTSGNGLAPNSTYTFAIPAGACFSGANHTWWFDIWVPGSGDVDAVPVRC